MFFFSFINSIDKINLDIIYFFNVLGLIQHLIFKKICLETLLQYQNIERILLQIKRDK